MSTLALEGSDDLSNGSRPPIAIRGADLGLLALALPAFVLAGWPIVGYAVAAGAWLAQRGLHQLADSASRRAIAARDRRRALGAVAAATLGRVWIVTLAILLVGLLAGPDDGLAAALLSLVLVTAFLVSRVTQRLLWPGEGER